MKTILTFLLVILVASLGYSQKKGKLDPKDLKIDSLTKVTNVLTKEKDSLIKDRQIYYGVYTAVKDSVIKYNFDPKRTPVLIDSLKSNRNNTFTGLTSASASLKDSLAILKKENKKCKASLDSLSVSGPDKNKLVAELRQIKELLDAKIISQEEYDGLKAKLLAKWE